jgi:hypothetical protein
VVYRAVPALKRTPVLCETSLVWRDAASDPVLARFIALVRNSQA